MTTTELLALCADLEEKAKKGMHEYVAHHTPGLVAEVCSLVAENRRLASALEQFKKKYVIAELEIDRLSSPDTER